VVNLKLILWLLFLDINTVILFAKDWEMRDQYILELFEAIRYGDRDAFEKFYNETWFPLFQTALSKTRDEAEAQDIIQDLYIRLWERREAIVIASNPSAYLRVMLRNEVVRRLRNALELRQKKERYAFSLQDLAENMEDIVLTKELEGQLDREINKLSPKQKEIFLMYYVEGQSSAEIASQLAIAEQTVKNQLVLSKRRLKVLIEGLAYAQIIAYLFR